LKDERVRQSLLNFGKALSSLEKAVKKENLSELEMAGAIQNFEICYEVCWKTLKKMAESEGRSAASPRTAFQYAFEARFITNEPIWVEMIKDRNLTTHIYDQATAEKIFQHIRENYFPALKKLYKIISDFP